MRIFDLFRIAIKNLKGSRSVLPAAAAAISAFCLCFAVTALTTVQQEKSQPYEISVSAEGSSLSENDVAEISKLTDVIEASPVLNVEAKVFAGEYSAELTLKGIYPSYLNAEFKLGDVFPENSVMPYIVLNEAACKQFKSKEDESEFEFDMGDNTENETEDKLPEINWLNESIKIQTGEGKPVTSKICGILEGKEKDEQPAAYLSLVAAKGLLDSAAPVAGYAEADVRITSIGSWENVSREISALGFSVNNTNKELQAKWDSQEGQMVYLFIIGGFCLLCLSVLMAWARKISLLGQQEEWKELKWAGMREKDIGRIFILQTLVVTVAGVFIGILVSTSLPSFLDPDPTGVSIYTLKAPLWAAAVSTAVCIFAGVLSMLNVRKSVSSYLG